jgi:hypothetical protein
MYAKNITPRMLVGNIITAIPERTKTKLKTFLWQIAIPLVFISIVILFFPDRGIFEKTSDEGVNLMKAMLLEKGYSLYDEIWSDQPPVLTHMLAGVLHVFGYKVGASRVLVLFLSAALLWSFFQILRLVLDIKYALVGAILLFILPSYMALSISVMVGLPSIAFAMVSLLALTAWHMHRRYLWTGFLAPIMVFGLLIAEYHQIRKNKRWMKGLFPALSWGLIFTSISIALGFILVGPENITQLLSTHLTGGDVEGWNEKTYTINWQLRPAHPTLFLAIVGIPYIVQKRQWLLLYPFAWMATAYLLLLNHSPVWFHHGLLVTIPAAMLASVPLTDTIPLIPKLFQWRYFRDYRRILQLAALIGTFFLIFTFRTPGTIKKLSLIPSLSTSGLEISAGQETLLKKMILHAPETRWVVTDLPMYAFRSRLPVPPYLAAFTMKRYQTGELTEQNIIDTVQEYQPEQILLGRGEYPLVEQFLQKEYRMIYMVGNSVKLFLRNDL